MAEYVSQLELGLADSHQDPRRYNQMECLKWIALKEEGYEDFTQGLAKLLGEKRGVSVNASTFAHIEKIEPFKEEELAPLLERHPAAKSLYHALRSGDAHALLRHVQQYPSPGLKRFCDTMDGLKRIAPEDWHRRLD